ncbi:hypothetical protein RRG08_063398 [Elysia crispata]|uniref:Sulfotransferase domain-containing protein n=1 Tax=Elysia crispata TaxID=231223 RepID=A0AAE1AXP0_9GAST|nr:hypothetical protein RRG08_063398 [Elysia crispata]
MVNGLQRLEKIVSIAGRFLSVVPAGKLCHLRLGFLLSFLGLLSFTYLLICSSSLLGSMRSPRDYAALRSAHIALTGGRNEGGNKTASWRRKAHGVIPIACKMEAQESEIMAMDPIKFLRNYKNPCWWERIQTPLSDLYTQNPYINYSYAISKTFQKLRVRWARQKSDTKYRLRCLPYFLLAGQPKCGSTDIYQRLITHPEIVAPPVKESHWWGKNRYGPVSSGNHSPGWLLHSTENIPLSHYVDLFDRSAVHINEIREESGDGFIHPAITGDGSVSTLWSNDDWWKNPENCGLSEPRYTNAHHVHKLIPQAKIIVILRNPVDRLYSDFLYFQKTAKARDHFHKASVQAIDALEECVQIFGIRSCVYNYTTASKSRARLRLGLYSVFLQEWLSVFPRDQILVVRLEDYSVAPLKTISRVYKFLGLKSLSAEEAEDVLEKPVANPRRAQDKKIGKMLPETRALLTTFYYKYNVQLARLLDDGRFLWDDPDL